MTTPKVFRDMGFTGSFGDILAALSRQPPRPLEAWENKVKGNRNKRTRERNRREAFKRKTAIKKMIDGDAARARPHWAPNRMPAARWPELLKAMGDDDRAVSDLCEPAEAARRATRSMLATMVKRGLVERRPNPEPPAFELLPGIVSRRKDLWLYCRTEKGARVAAGSDEWRKERNPNANRWQYKRRRDANAAAGPRKWSPSNDALRLRRRRLCRRRCCVGACAVLARRPIRRAARCRPPRGGALSPKTRSPLAMPNFAGFRLTTANVFVAFPRISVGLARHDA